jgi:transcriptional regulator with PAS, ATPase and Fis domain
MNKILISWLAYNNDFDNGVINPNGPNIRVHEHFLADYDYHLWLMPWKENGDNSRVPVVNYYVRENNLFEKVRIENIPINDPIDINEIRGKSEVLLNTYADKEIDVFISPGTPAMQTAWYFLSLNHPIKLFQARDIRYRKDRKFTKEYIELDLDRVAGSAVIKQFQPEKKSIDKDYLIDLPSITSIYKRASQIATTDRVTALIQGASGTGKEHLARYIHENSSRKEAPFIAVNCSAFSDNLLESRLFGFKKGAFTGAEKDHEGIFELANGGTVFLDEIGDISPYMQQTLLRVLQENEINLIGDPTPKKIDVRIISATNKNLVKECQEGNFRWDLFYRLAVVELSLPILSERGYKEVDTLIDFFLETKRRKFKRKSKLKFSKEALSFIKSYPFPGNIRELENLIEGFYVFCEETIEIEDIPERLVELKKENSWELEVQEGRHIKKAYSFFGNNKKRTAEALGVAYNTLVSKLEKLNLV